MGSITYQNLFSEARESLVNLISNNVSDPTTSSAEYRKWIYAREPDVKSDNFAGYPFIIIHPVDVDLDSDEYSADGKRREVNWEIEIEIITSDRGYGGNDGQGLSQMDTISNSIVETLMDASNRATLRVYGLSLISPTTSSVGTDVVDNQLVYRRSITVSFRNWFTVSG